MSPEPARSTSVQRGVTRSTAFVVDCLPPQLLFVPDAGRIDSDSNRVFACSRVRHRFNRRHNCTTVAFGPVRLVGRPLRGSCPVSGAGQPEQQRVALEVVCVVTNPTQRFEVSLIGTEKPVGGTIFNEFR